MTGEASTLEPAAQVNGNVLHGKGAPRYVIEEEEPWHRAAAYLFACGTVTIKDVAEAVEKDPATVSNLLRQRWFQERVTKLMADHGGQDIMQLFRAEQFNSLVTLVEIRDAGKSERNRATCAIEILNRSMGKPTQRVETTTTPTSDDPVAEVARLESEMKQ